MAYEGKYRYINSEPCGDRTAGVPRGYRKGDRGCAVAGHVRATQWKFEMEMQVSMKFS